MKEFVFDRKNYSSHQDLYKDMSIQMENVGLEDYYDRQTFDFNPNILLEYITCEFAYRNIPIRIVFRNFDKEEILKQKNYEDHQYSLIFQVLEIFVKTFPDNQLEFE